MADTSCGKTRSSRLSAFSTLPEEDWRITEKRTIKGVVFDMDGTLTVPCIDFADMRRRVGVPPDRGDILDIINSWESTERRKEAFAIIAEIEEEALRNMKVMPGAEELCRLLDNEGVPRGLVTRNVSRSVDFFHRMHFPLPPFSPSLSREWTPYKPDPAALHHIAERWGVDSSELLMIGDSAKDDVVCGNRAGSVTMLLDSQGVWQGKDDPRLTGDMKPHLYCNSLHEAADLVRRSLNLESPPHPWATLE